MTNVREAILAAYGIDETDPDWVALDEALTPVEAEARAIRVQYEAAVLAQLGTVIAKLNELLPPGFTFSPPGHETD